MDAEWENLRWDILMQNIENTVEGQGHFNGSKVCDKHISMFNCVHKSGGNGQ